MEASDVTRIEVVPEIEDFETWMKRCRGMDEAEAFETWFKQFVKNSVRTADPYSLDMYRIISGAAFSAAIVYTNQKKG